MRPLCIYHGSCDDGFAAAWAVREATGDMFEFYPGVYQQPPPDVAGRHVLMVDFSYKRPVVEQIAAKAKSVLIIDHHLSAMEDLKGVGVDLNTYTGPLGWERHLANVDQDYFENCPQSVYTLFDMGRSGAGMAWDFFHGAPRPAFINYIEDRDLWRKQLPNGDEFTIALRSYEQKFDIWDALVAAGPESLIKEGHSIQRYFRLRVEELKRSAYLAVIVLPGTDIHVPCAAANAPYFAASEVAGELCDMDGADFGLTYFEVRQGKWAYSLRSRGDFDVSAIAKAFGGGGHKNAAGFTVDAPVHRPALS